MNRKKCGKRERERERVFPSRVCVNLFFPVLQFGKFLSVIPRGPKGLDGARGDPCEVAEGAGRGAEGPRVDCGEAAVLIFLKFFFLSLVEVSKKREKRRAPKTASLCVCLSLLLAP